MARATSSSCQSCVSRWWIICSIDKLGLQKIEAVPIDTTGDATGDTTGNATGDTTGDAIGNAICDAIGDRQCDMMKLDFHLTLSKKGNMTTLSLAPMRWERSLCSCTDAPGGCSNCLKSFTCPCCVSGTIAETAGHSWIYGCLLCPCCGPCMRTDLRRVLGIDDGSACDDVGARCLCPCCALA